MGVSILCVCVCACVCVCVRVCVCVCVCVCIISYTQGGLTSVKLLTACEPHQEKNAEKERHEHLRKCEKKRKVCVCVCVCMWCMCVVSDCEKARMSLTLNPKMGVSGAKLPFPAHMGLLLCTCILLYLGITYI